ncbi:MAG: YraN family protein [Spirochaetaceae bacterium]|nr:MAG: YraN family protein [Spirochaetaceae bacterium]
MSSSREKGRRGEDLAACYLQQKGYRILARNFRCRAGEVDIVCETERTLLFVEVKSWRVLPRDALEPAIGPAKQKRIVRTARYFLHRYAPPSEWGIRFDVVFINPETGTIRYIEGAFEAPCPE